MRGQLRLLTTHLFKNIIIMVQEFDLLLTLKLCILILYTQDAQDKWYVYLKFWRDLRRHVVMFSQNVCKTCKYWFSCKSQAVPEWSKCRHKSFERRRFILHVVSSSYMQFIHEQSDIIRYYYFWYTVKGILMGTHKQRALLQLLLWQTLFA